MFGPGSIYSPLLYGFLIGALLPIPAWLLLKRYPNATWLKYVHFPVMLSSISYIPKGPAGEFPAWFVVGFLFNFVIFRYAHSWWKRYAFVFSAAMDCGVVICALFIYFVLTNNHMNFPKWWGSGGITGDGCPLANGNFSGILPQYKPII